MLLTLSPSDYYPHFALGRIYTTLRQYEEAINALTKAAALSEQAESATVDDRTSIYKALGRAYFQPRPYAMMQFQHGQKSAEFDPENIFAQH